MFKNFHDGSSEAIKGIIESSCLISKMCIYDEKMYGYSTMEIALSVVIYAIKDMFLTLQLENHSQSYNLIN